MRDQRKHRLQMTPREIQAVEAFIRAPRRWAICPYASRRMAERSFGAPELAKTLRTGQVIEVHVNDWPDVRAVVRLNTVCVAVSLKAFEVVTVWWNKSGDGHDTLNLANYRWRPNLVEFLNL